MLESGTYDAIRQMASRGKDRTHRKHCCNAWRSQSKLGKVDRPEAAIQCVSGKACGDGFQILLFRVKKLSFLPVSKIRAKFHAHGASNAA
jgi:hypothetical protein